MLERSVETPCKWYTGDPLPQSGRYAIRGCDYRLVTGEGAVTGTPVTVTNFQEIEGPKATIE